VQTVQISSSSPNLYVASYDFNIGAFQNRKVIVEKAYFNASGSVATFSPVQAFSAPFPDWPTTYPVAAWESVLASTGGGVSTELSIQVRQVLPGSSLAIPGGTFLFSRVPLGTFNLLVYKYSSAADLLNNAVSAPIVATTTASSVSHAMVVTKNRCNLFWVKGSRLHYWNFDGAGTPLEYTFPYADIDGTFGVSGCPLNDGAKDWVAVAYLAAATNVKIVCFPSSDFPNLATAPPSVSSIAVEAIDSNKVSIVQNPRTRRNYLLYTKGSTARYDELDFNNGNFTTIAGPIDAPTSPPSWLDDWGFELGGFDNFETSFSINQDTSNLRDVLVKNPITVNQNFAGMGYPTYFQFRDSGIDYAGLVFLENNFSSYQFWRRPLVFPATSAWDASTKRFHIEGPPLPGSVVTVEANFPEMATGSCVAHMVNAAGLTSPFVGSAGVIASSGSQFTLVFDRDMPQSSYSSWVGAAAGKEIRLLDGGGVATGITYLSGTARTLTFTNDSDLAFNSVYQVSIAGSVTDLLGSQLWGPATLSFTTQLRQSGLLASEVQGVAAYSDSGRTVLIPSGSEINASTTLFFRVIGVDPAPNTIDLATLAYSLDGTGLGNVSLNQPLIATTSFLGTTTTSIPWGGSHTLTYVTASPTAAVNFNVSFPTLSSLSPASAAGNVPINSPIVLIFSEAVLAGSLTPETLRLHRAGVFVTYTAAVTGNVVTLDPDDSTESYLKTDCTYTIEIGPSVSDLFGNPFNNSPATYSSIFTTQASQTFPTSIASVALFSDNSFLPSSQLTAGSDFPATGTVFIEMAGVDGNNLTRDSTIASISGGNQAVLTETASSSGIYRGQFSFSSWPDRVPMPVQSTVTPGASLSLLITYPGVSPVYPASGSTGIPVSAVVRVKADEALIPVSVTGTSARLLLGGVQVGGATVAYDGAAKEITITPSANLVSEGLYVVDVRGVTDVFGNPLLQPLSFQFTAADTLGPTIVSHAPVNGETGVIINRQVVLNFSENIAVWTVSKSSIQLLRDGVTASFSLSTTGNTVNIVPDDTPEHGLQVGSNYTFLIGTGVQDLNGNPFSNSPATYSATFSTQPRSTPPAAMSSLLLFKDALRSQGFLANGAVSGSATIYLKISGTDGATQTLDITTATLKLSWSGAGPGAGYAIRVAETASDSGGLYYGQIALDSIPLYGFPVPAPPTTLGTLSWQCEEPAPHGATLTIAFPQWSPAGTRVWQTAGPVTASGATNVSIDSPMEIAFNSPLSPVSITSSSLQFLQGGNPVSAFRSVDGSGKLVTIAPAAMLVPGQIYGVTAPYSAAGLRNPQGNPIFQPFSFTFETQASQTPPIGIRRVSLFPNSSFSPLDELATDSDYPATGTVYIELEGQDGAPLTIDRAGVAISTGDSAAMTETGPGTGLYRGSFTFGGLIDRFRLTVQSLTTPTASQSLRITYPHVSPSSPASGSSKISVFTPVQIVVDEPIDPTSISASSIRLTQGGVIVPSSLAYNAVSGVITLIPDFALQYNALETLTARGLFDLVGNPQVSTLTFSFQTQASSLSPTTILGMRIFSDSGYSVQLASGTVIGAGETLYLEVTATDRSNTSFDSTIVEQLTDRGPGTATAALVETGLASGIFRGSIVAFPAEGALLTFRSSTDPTIMLQLMTFSNPFVSSISPASGSTDIPLDTLFILSANKAIDPATVISSNIRLADSSGILTASFSLLTPKTLYLESDLATQSPVQMAIANLRDTDGLFFPAFNAHFTSRAASFNKFEAFSDAGFTLPIAAGSEIEPGATVRVRLSGRDLRTRTLETTTGVFSDGTSTGSFTLGEVSLGIFEGSFSVPHSPGHVLSVAPDLASNLGISFLVTADFRITGVFPVDGSVAVPADTWPGWSFSHPVDPARVDLSRFTITRLLTNAVEPASLTVSPDRLQVTIQPWSFMELLENYEIRVASDVLDQRGRPLGVPFVTRFSTQPPPPPPLEVSSLDNYRDSSFTATSTHVPPDGMLYLEVRACDRSFSTIDTTRVRVTSSDGGIPGDEVTLEETGNNTGIFRVSMSIDLPVGTSITVQSQGKPVFIITLKVVARPVLIGLNPASGSSGLTLDQPIVLGFDKPMDGLSLASGVVCEDGSKTPVLLARSISPDGLSITISPMDSWATGSQHQVFCTDRLFGADGVGPRPVSFFFGTSSPDFAELELYSGLPPVAMQRVSVLREALPGTLLVVASTTNLFSRRPETRQTRLRLSGSSIPLVLSESAAQPGNFTGSYLLPDSRGTIGSVTLEFFSNPSISFTIPFLPGLIGFSPASGARQVSETPVIEASFTRKIFLGAGAGSLTLRARNAVVPVRSVIVGNASSVLRWEPTGSLPPGASCTASFANLTDLLGQPVTVPTFGFTIVGTDGITIYEDRAFTRLLPGGVISVPEVFVEVVASGPWTSTRESPSLRTLTQRNATAPVLLPLAGAATETRRFQNQIRFEAGRGFPSLLLPLVPGEQVELSSPILTNRRRVFNYRVKGDTPPARIKALSVYRDGFYAERIEGDLQQAQLFIEIQAEDLNWVNIDTTRIKATSTTDQSGVEFPLVESGVHSGLFRGDLTLANITNSSGAILLRASAGDTIVLASVTDPAVSIRFRYLPETRINHPIAWPSPARGDMVTFSFYLTFSAEIELFVYDMAGDEVYYTSHNGKPGENRIPWHFPQHLANGAYFFELKPFAQTEFQIKQKKIRGKFAVLR